MRGENIANTWTINDQNDGSVSNANGTITFIDFNHLNGGNLIDDFTFNSNGSVTGLIEGGAGAAVDTLNLTNLNAGISVQLGTSVNSNLNVNGIERIDAASGNALTNQLIGEDLITNTWNINNPNSGSVNSVNFTHFANLSGGSGTDNFTFTASGSLAGLIDGNDGADSVNVVALGSSTVEVGTDITANINIVEIEDLQAAAGVTNTLIGDDIDTNWTISLNDNGTIGNTTYTNFSQLIGGSGDDTYSFLANNTFTGSIDGGAHNLGDSIDYSLWTNGEANLGASGNAKIENVELITGNNQNNRIIGADLNSDWNINSENNQGNVLIYDNNGNRNVQFSGFNTITLGTGADDITIDIAIGSTSDLNLNAGTGDTLTITGNNANLNGHYTQGLSNVAGTLQYNNVNGTYTLNFDDPDTVQDNVNTTNYTINGSSGNDTIALSNNQFNINGGLAVNYNNKPNLNILGQNGNDTINLLSNLNLSNGTLTLQAETLTNPMTIDANTLILDGFNTIGSNNNRLNTTIDHLAINNSTGTTYLNESNALNISSFNNNTGQFNLTAGGAVTSSVALITDTNLNINSNGNITLNNSNNQLSGQITLTTGNNITLNNRVDTNLNTINAQTLSATITGNLSDSGSGSLNITNSATLNASGDITLDNANNNFNTITISANNITLNDNSAITLNTISAQGTIDITASQITQTATITSNGDLTLNAAQGITMSAGSTSHTNTNIHYQASNDTNITQLTANNISITSSNGQIIDNNGNANNLNANRAELSANTGIGENDAIEMQVSQLHAENNSGVIELSNRGAITLERLANRGDILFNSDNDIHFTPGSTDAGYDIGELIMITEGGSFLGVGPTPSRVENYDITARAATFFDTTLSGTFGSLERPLTLRVRDIVVLTTGTSFTPIFAEPKPKFDTTGSLFNINSFDAISAISAGQLVEVESLEDVDPAIFTDVRNYSYDEIAIRLPRDQLFEDELEDEARDERLGLR